MPSRQPLIDSGPPLQGRNTMTSSVPIPSLSSKIYKAVISPFQKLQLLFPRVSGTVDVNFTTQDGHQLLHLKAEIGGPSKEFDTTNCATTTFHKFNGLPVELRAMIWRLSFRRARIFRLGPIPGHNEIGCTQIISPHKPPASAQACRESQALFKGEARQLFGLNLGIYKSLWFLPSTDIVYWDEEMVCRYLLPGTDEIDDVWNVAVKWPDTEESNDKLDRLLEDVREMFPDCKRLMFVMRHQPLLDTDISFIQVKDDDEMHIRWHGDWSTWGEIKRDIHEYWPRYKHEDHTVVPMMEVVEVMRVRAGTQPP
ncbi:uncharacterized protein FMAN_00855 [Fusarium mangiferae]|uniref:2EXR domain-containing protein n=1 Tax=Fusarium mangiferae TaxID=192010 RepID=A0A1L7SG83_FUSMA|nr:uncharacterized protein FMAN_00855 [Fusarium mangiferae]CVK83383.1 uncharacterized protein FMAN_00855 [Fusarium mangiferae]